MKTGKKWYTTKDGKIDRIQEIGIDKKPMPENKNWKECLVDTVSKDESLDWFEISEDGIILRKLTDEEYLKKMGRIDPRGVWYHKERTKPDVTIYDIDSDPPGDDYTLEPLLENKPYQKFDEAKKKWVVDTEKKDTAEKEKAISEKQSAIDNAERRIQRSTRAKLAGTATEEDERFFTEINAEINQLREEKRQLLLSA